jgi:N-acetylglucosamine-6-phosphate deacetylase
MCELHKLFSRPVFCYDSGIMRVIDVHTHGLGGYDTTAALPEEILKIAEIHGSYGVSAIVPTIYPAPVDAMRAQIGAVKKAMEVQGGTGKGVGDAKILGVHLEGPFLNPLRPGALDPSTFISPQGDAYRAIVEGFEDVVRIVTVSPELDGAPGLIKEMADAGVVVSMGHSDATFMEAEAGFHHGARGITHLFNAMRAYHHREPGIAGFGLLNRGVYVEVIGDPHHLHPGAIEMIFRMKDPSKIVIVSDSVEDTGVREDRDGGGLRDRSGTLTGGAMTVTEAARRLTRMGFDEEAVRRCITANPEAYLKTVTEGR